MKIDIDLVFDLNKKRIKFCISLTYVNGLPKPSFLFHAIN